MLVLLCCVLTTGLTGCGQGGAKLVPVEGKVTMGAKPVPTGTVIFYPDAARGNTSKEEPRGDIDAGGNYQLLTGTHKGVAPGWYKVAVTAADQVDPNNPYFTKWLVPERYIDPRTSKLEFEVGANQPPGAFDIKLEGK
jgi:hypothetical protein